MRALRIVVMWLIALALPVQGLAAATMLSCGGGDHQQVASHDHHDHAMEHGGEQAAPNHDHAKCSACADCCIAGALPAAVMTLDPLERTTERAAAWRAAPASFVTGGPERPPRHLLA